MTKTKILLLLLLSLLAGVALGIHACGKEEETIGDIIERQEPREPWCGGKDCPETVPEKVVAQQEPAKPKPGQPKEVQQDLSYPGIIEGKKYCDHHRHIMCKPDGRCDTYDDCNNCPDDCGKCNPIADNLGVRLMLQFQPTCFMTILERAGVPAAWAAEYRADERSAVRKLTQEQKQRLYDEAYHITDEYPARNFPDEYR